MTPEVTTPDSLAQPVGDLTRNWASKPLELISWLFLCLFVFTMPWEKGVWVPGIGTIARTLGMVAFVAGTASVLYRRKLRSPNLMLVTSALFVLWSGLSYLWSIDPAATIAKVSTLAQLLAMVWLVWELCRGPARQEQLMSAYVLGALLGAGITFIRYGMSIQTYYRRYAATGFDPNDFGLILVFSIPMAIYLAWRHAGWLRWLWTGSVLMVISAVLLTASRTALVATFLSFLIVPLLWARMGMAQRLASLALFGYLIFSLVGAAPSSSRERLATLPEEITEGNFNSRKSIWKSGARYWIRHPVLGAGSGAYPEAVRPELGVPGVKGARYVAHNTFLSVLVECGIPGFTIYAALMLTLVVFIWMMPTPERFLWAVMLLVWVTGVTTLTWEHYKVTWLLFALIVTEWSHGWWRENNPLTGRTA